MCGIAGIIKLNGQSVEEGSVRAMMVAQKHRGPDDEGTYIKGNVGLGFVRLSIIDLSQAGHQPMLSPDGRYVVVYNGEIYNYIELRDELQKHGHIFFGDSDTEVLLHAYMQWGKTCLHRFNGMFAFAIFDTREKQLFCARDRFGIKPFYYYQDSNQLVFASEIPAILKILPNKPKHNDQAIYDYLVFNRLDHTEHTFYQGIRKLPHAHSLTCQDNQIKINRWYQLAEQLNKPFSNNDEFRELFSSSIGLRLRSDVPVGVCLSGGLDSSSIVSLLLEDHKKQDLNTFSAVYGGDHINAGRKWNVDETSYIKEFEGKVHKMHYITPSADTLMNDLFPFIRTHGEPVSSTGPYAQYKVMELAHGNVVVTLDGQGGDEQLAGYHYFFGVLFKELLYSFQWLKMTREILAYRSKHGSNFGLKMLMFFLLPSSLKTALRSSTRQYINPEFNAQYKTGKNPITEVLYGANSLKESLINHFEHKLEHLLKWEDRNSMHFSIEARVPFLDHRLVEQTLAMPGTQKISDGMTKKILRDSMKNHLPYRIQNRKDEVGFDTPEDIWFRSTKFTKLISDIIHSTSFANRGYYNTNKVKTLFSAHLEGNSNISKDIWKWINLELWFREFID